MVCGCFSLVRQFQNFVILLSSPESSENSGRSLAGCFRTWSALKLLIMLIHWRVVKQIVQSLFVLVGLRRAAAFSAPKRVERREVIAAAFNLTVVRQLKWNKFDYRHHLSEMQMNLLTWRNRCFCITCRSRSFKYSGSPSCRLRRGK